MDEYCEDETRLPDSIRGYVADVMDGTETFRAGVKTTAGGFTQSVWLVVTSDQLVVVTSKLVDATLRRVPLADIAETRSSLVDLPEERRRQIEIETVDDTLTYELHDPDGTFIEDLQTAVADVPDPELADPAYPTDVDGALRNCERVVEAAASARRDGSFVEASDRYETAITGYRTVRDRLPAGDDRRDAIEETLTEIRDTRQQIAELRERRATLESRLAAAENSFQTAVRAHLEREQTVAKIRYRQARDGFEEALELIDADDDTDADAEPIEAPVHVSPDADTLAVSGALDEFAGLSTATTDALSDNAIAAVADLRARATGPTTVDADAPESTPIRDLFESTPVDQADVPILFALAWQQTETISFAARTDVRRRIEQAASGYDATV